MKINLALFLLYSSFSLAAPPLLSSKRTPTSESTTGSETLTTSNETPPSADEIKISHVIEKCSKGWSEFQKNLTQLEEKADDYVQATPLEKIRTHFKNEDEFYEFLIFLAPYVLPKKSFFTSYYMECWTHWNDAMENYLDPKVKNKKKIEEYFDQWAVCIQSGFRDETPPHFSELLQCSKNLLQSYEK